MCNIHGDRGVPFPTELDYSMKPTEVVILLLLGGVYSASAMPSAACLVASQTENVIRCLSLNENFQETLASGDLCEQARVVYTCYNRTCCEENRAYDIERDPSIAACNIDCLRTTPPPSTSSTSAAWTTPPPEPNPSEAPYITTMAPFTTPSPAPPPRHTSFAPRLAFRQHQHAFYRHRPLRTEHPHSA